MFASDSGVPSLVRTRPVRMWLSHVHASQAELRVPREHCLLQSIKTTRNRNIQHRDPNGEIYKIMDGEPFVLFKCCYIINV